MEKPDGSTDSPAFRVLARASQLDEGAMVSVASGDGRAILLARVDGRIRAVSDVCSHLRAPLHRGALAGHRLSCPLHGGAFDIRDGAPLCHPATTPIATYPVRTRGDDVEVAVGAVTEPAVSGFEW